MAPGFENASAEDMRLKFLRKDGDGIDSAPLARTCQGESTARAASAADARAVASDE